MTANGHSAVLKVLPASAMRVPGNKWELSLPKKEAVDVLTQKEFDEFIKNLGEWDSNKELVLFIRASVTEKDFLVLGTEKVPERNLLSSVFKMAGTERHIFFFTAAYSHDDVKQPEKPDYESNDHSLMKGVSLYRISCNPNTDIPIDKIKAHAGIEDADKKPGSAVEFYRQLNKNDKGNSTEMRMAMVPKGKISDSVSATAEEKATHETKTKYALLLAVDRGYEGEQSQSEKDLEYMQAICKRMNIKDTECTDIVAELSNINRAINKDTVKEKIRDCAGEYKKNIKDIGQIWVFVSAHGSHDKGIILSGSGEDKYISIAKLIKPLFNGELSGITKIIVVDACRGDFPPSVSEPDSKCESKLGLLFRNEDDDGNDPWDLSTIKKKKRKKYVILFGSVPGFKSWETEQDSSLMLKAMLTAVQELKKPEEWHAFVQRVQWCLNEQDKSPESKKPENLENPKSEAATSQEDSERINEQQNLESGSTRPRENLRMIFYYNEAASVPMQQNSSETDSFPLLDPPSSGEEAADSEPTENQQDQQANGSTENCESSQAHSVTRCNNDDRLFVVTNSDAAEGSDHQSK